MSSIGELQVEIHKTAFEKGWWDRARTFPEIIALCHSELSEALEAVRDGNGPAVIYDDNGKPEGAPVEMADCIIRILDWAEVMGLDMGEIIKQKMEYNRTRTYRHGGKSF